MANTKEDMVDGYYRVLTCECGHPILLPPEMLGQLLLALKGRTKYSEMIAAVCDHCKRVRNYDLTKTKPNPDWGKVILPNSPGWAYVESLRCQEQTCEAPLPLFAKWNSAMTSEEREGYVKTWTWDNLICPNAHPISNPD